MRNLSFQFKNINFFYLSLILFACSLPLSEFMVSTSAGLMFLTALIEGNLSGKIERIKQRKVILFLPAIFLIYLFSAIIIRNGDTVFYDLRKALFFIILPLSFLIGRSITDSQKQRLILFYIVFVIIAAVYAFFNWKIIHAHENFNIHNASLITHIRFSFQLILAFWFLIFLAINNSCHNKILAVLIMAAVGLTGFLFLQKSLTGIVSFVGTLIFVFLYLALKLNGYRRYLLLSLLLLLIIAPIIYIGKIAYPFYHPKEYTEGELSQETKSGNTYNHDFNNRLIENGNLVYLFVCEEEMKAGWNNVSALKYDSLDQNGYEVKTTLVRYLTSKGLKKDGEGVKALTGDDIRNVENGISNHLFTKNDWSLFPRIYCSVWEYYGYKNLNQVNNQSLSQRLEFAKAALSIIKENFWFGVGAGNWKTAFFDTYKKMNSNLTENYYASSHNQFLNYLVKFGVVGFLLIMFFLVYPVVKTKRYYDPVFLIFLGFMFIANFADSNLESHMGSSFFVFFYCFFLVSGGIDYFKLHPK